MRKDIVFLLLAAFTGLAVAVGVEAQSAARNGAPSQQQATLAGVHVVGSSRYADEDIAAATGLSIGSKAGPQDFKAAADKLVASGAFEEVRYQYQPAGTGYVVEFRVTDATQFLPVIFDNFVWYSDQELSDAVRQRVPLFKGQLATAGEMVDQVTDALQGLITERGIPGQVRFMPESNLTGEVERGVFSIEGVTVRIRAVKFTGISEPERPLIENEGRKLANASYQLSIVRRFADLNLKPLYLAQGFLKVTFSEPVTELVQNDTREPAVDVTIPVSEGSQYRLSEVVWAGNKILSAEDLSQVMKEKPGRVLDAVQFGKDVERAEQAYGSKGYLRASVRPHESFDDAQKTVSYRMDVQEGSQYRLGSVDLAGLDKLTMARLREAWRLREGEAYDTGYEREFMKSIGPLLAPNISVAVSHEINDQARTVDVNMKFIVHADKVIR